MFQTTFVKQRVPRIPFKARDQPYRTVRTYMKHFVADGISLLLLLLSSKMSLLGFL